MPSQPGEEVEEHFFNMLFTAFGVRGESSNSSVMVGEGTQLPTQSGKQE